MQVYREPFELAESVATYLAAGFDAGEPAVVVATAAHLPLFGERLRRRGWDAGELEAAGTLVVADAERTLAAIMDGSLPSPRRFAEVVGPLLERARGEMPARRVRVFGEMVDLLCRRGETAAADGLEELWNRLGENGNFSLLCGYRVDVFDRDAQLRLLPQVYRAHSHVLPAPDAERVDAAVTRALVEVLGEDDADKVYARSQRRTSEPASLSLRALMWVTANMPLAGERVLAAARGHYLAPDSA